MVEAELESLIALIEKRGGGRRGRGGRVEDKD
jgi:hypothetical protein